MTVAATASLAEHVSAADARTELARFFQIAEVANSAPQMFSAFIDAEWHRLMESKDDYTRLCMESVGHLVSHQEGPGYGVVSWVELYHERFGVLPATWFASAEGTVDIGAYEFYLDSRATSGPFQCSTGVPHPCEVGSPPSFVTAWDCTPTTGDPDYIETSPDTPIPPVPDEALPAQ